MAQIHCPQLNQTFGLIQEKSLMDNLLSQGVPVASSCHGDGICGKCHMRVESAQPLPPMGELEQKTLHRNRLDSGQRLSCQLYLIYDCQVTTTYW